jgi:beta-lactamase class A
MKRRTALASLVALGAVPGLGHGATEAELSSGLSEAVRSVGQLQPRRSAAALSIQGGNGPGEDYQYAAQQPLFVGSAVKTFMLAQYLRDVERGTLSLDTAYPVGPEFWSPGSKVLQNVQGTMAARSILEAMITHSDNTATDIVLHAVGPDRVRQLIQTAGLEHTRIPDSTRKLFSYLAGAPSGTDLGWKGLMDALNGPDPENPRPAINDQQTMLSTAAEMARWYRHVLGGGVFETPEMLREFKRISAMADAISLSVPDDILGYGKGGSIEWGGFNCFALAGQMVLPAGKRADFCFVVNWDGGSNTVAPMFDVFVKRARKTLALAAQPR